MPDPVKTSYTRDLYNTVNSSYLRGGIQGGPVSTQQQLTSPLDAGIAVYQDPDYRRGELQTGWEQFKHAGMQSLAEIVGGTIEGIGYLGDLHAYGDMLTQGEAEVGNALVDFAIL